MSQRQQGFQIRYLSWPTLIWFTFFILLPLVIVFVVSFLQRGSYGGIEIQLSLRNYWRALDANYFYIFLSSLQLAIFTAAVCVIVSVPMAWAMVTSDPAKRNILFTLVALPFLTNLIIRVYAIKTFVGFNGPLQYFLHLFRVEYDPFVLTSNSILVAYGLFVSYLPFAILPLYAAFEKFDFSQVEAAQDLGSSQWQILFRIIIPQLKHAIQISFILVFIPALGEYVIPDLLGGAKTMLIGNFIAEEFLKARDWPFGAAISVLLILVLVFAASLLALQRKKVTTHE